MIPSISPIPHHAETLSNSFSVRDVITEQQHDDNGGEGSADESAAALLSVDKVSQLMREQDADLLESMHYASAQVSQYSPGGTPILRPKDRFLAMEDVPLIMLPLSLSSTSQLLLNNPQNSGSSNNGSSSSSSKINALSTAWTASFGDAPHMPPRSSSLLSLGRRSANEATTVMKLSWQHEEASDNNNNSNHNNNQELTDHEDDSRYRRLLSGEVRTIDKMDAEEQEQQQQQQQQSGGVGEEEETTASPISVAHEASTSTKNEQESGLAEQRRVHEAIQFAEAVGEEIAINRDELCIIEDHTDDGESCDSDDDEACEPTEIRVNDIASIHEEVVLSQGQPHEQQQRKLEHEAPAALPSHVDVHPTPDLSRRKTKRPLWPFDPAGSEYRFLDNLSGGIDKSNFVYKGICANPPEITKRGIQRGNYAQLHRKAWLEVSDKYHRYGKNLRSYYRVWESLGFPTNQFFEWLDSKGEAAGQPLPNLDECPRSVLDSDTVLYITNPEVTEGYALNIVCNEEGRGTVIDVDGAPVLTGTDGWIFVLRDNVMYGAQKITSISGHSKKRFHHSSFFGGKAVSSAGIVITDEEGRLNRLYPHSGHYRPGEAHMQRMLFFLHRKGVDLRTFKMDTQQFRHVSRDKEGKGKDKKEKDREKEGKGKDKDGEKKAKKVDNLHLEKAVNVACFLSHKAGFIGNGIFDKIHKIRKADVANVSEALEMVDDGGYWPKILDEADDTAIIVQ